MNAHTNAGQSAPAFREEPPRREVATVLRRERRVRAELVQLIALLVAVVLALLVPQISIGFWIPASRAIEMLVAVGAGTVTFIGVVFSLLFLVVQFGSTAFSPRLNLFRDAPIVWRAFSLFTAIVAYSFTAAIVIGGDERTSALVPIVAFAGVIASIVAYRQLQLGAFKSIQLASTLAQIAARGRTVLDGFYTAPAASSVPADVIGCQGRGPADAGVEIRWTRPAAILQVIDVPRVLSAAERADALIEFKLESGEMISEGVVVAVVHGPTDDRVERELLDSLTVGEERTFEQDPGLALRVLADITLRALSPAVNDPTTAVQAIDAADGLLRKLARSELEIGKIYASDGTLRVILQLPSWDDYLDITLEEVAALPTLSPAVSRRIVRLLSDLEAIAPETRRSGLADRRRKFEADRRRDFEAHDA